MSLHPVRALQQRRRRGEEGFSLIEVMAALTIIAVAMVAVATVFYGGLRTAGASNFRSAAAALATRETEAVHGVPYDQVGFYADQADYVATFEGKPTVELADTSPVDPTDILVVPLSDNVNVGGPIRYDVRRHLIWADAEDVDGTNLVEAYKKTVVIVSWTDDAGDHEVRQDSIFYPGAQEEYTGPGSGIVTPPPPPGGVPGQPTALTAATPPAPDGYTAIDLQWTAPTTGAAVNHYYIERSTNPAFTGSLPVSKTAATNLRITGLSDNTTYHFRVYAVGTASPDESGKGVASDPAFATTLVLPAPVCTVNSMVLSSPADGGANLKTNNRHLDEVLTVTLSVNAACAATPFGARLEDLSGNPNPVLSSGNNPKTFTPLGGTTRTVSWAAHSSSGVFAAGDHKIALVDGAGDPWAPSAFTLVRICSNGVMCP